MSPRALGVEINSMQEKNMSKDEMSSEKWVEESASFLQSQNWANFQKSLGRKVLQFNFFMQGDELRGEKLVANFYFYKLPIWGGYWYCPRGPVAKTDSVKKFLESFPEFSKNFSSERPRPFFVRMEFCSPPTEDFIFQIKKSGFEKSPHPTQPEMTSLINLRLSEEDLLKAMHPKTRYGIKVAQKNGIEIREVETLDAFLELLHETSARNKFRLHPDIYYKRLFDFFSDPKKSLRIKIFGAFLGNTLLSANMIIFYGKRATYLHGASSSQNRNFMAPHLLHWEIMRMAKTSGFWEYDFWGIDQKKWPGVTRFKEGFGGTKIKYTGSYDFPLNLFYYKIYKTAHYLKDLLRFKWL